MTASFTKSNLLSRQIRTAVTEGTGFRKINFNEIVSVVEEGDSLRKFFIRAKNFASWSWGFLFGNFSFSGAVDWITDTAFELVQFDWNQTDEEIRQEQEQLELSLFSTWGGFVGSGVGWLTSIALGYGVTVALPVIGSARLAKLVTTAASDEAAAALLGELNGAVRSTAGVLGRSLALQQFTSVRRFLRENNPRFSKWGRQGGPRFVLAEKYEQLFEKIPSKKLRAFLQAGSERFVDSLLDGVYVIAAELDAQLAAGEVAGNKTLGATRSIDLYPDNRTQERIRIEGPQKLIEQQIVEEITSHRRLAGKDVGVIIGEEARSARTPAPDKRVLRITFKNREKPPWGAREPEYKRSILKIPDLKQTSWEELKRILKPYNWGRFYHVIPLDNGRKIMSHGSTPGEAKQNAERLLKLTTAKPLSNRVAGEQEDQNELRRKRSVRMYPVAATFEFKTPATVGEQSYVSPEGSFFEVERGTFDLWPISRPEDVPARL